MNKKINKPKEQGAGRPAASPGTYRLAGFPREFERNLWEDLDKRFYLILLCSWVFVYAVALILGNTEYDLDAMRSKVRQNYLEKFYQAAIVSDLEAIEEEGGPGIGEEEAEEEEPVDERAERDRGKQSEARGPSAREMAETRRAAAAERSRARAQMEQQVAGTGVLGVLSAGGVGGTGDAVVDVLGGAGGGGDLDAVLSSVGGLATATSASQRTRLGSRGSGRATGSADVNELLSGGIGTVGSSNIGRKGSIKMALATADVTGTGSKAANRSGDELSRVINSHNDAIEYCYKKEAKLNPNLQGDVLIEFTVGFNGRVKGSRVVQSSLSNRAVENCIMTRIRGWRFKPIARNEGDVTVRQKYIFG
jgi:TonB family protein